MRDLRPGMRRSAERAAAREKYATYIRSRAWFARREKWAQVEALNGEIKCAGCGQTWHLSSDDLHHCDYDRLGHEDHKDLWAMCRACHDVLHSLLDGQKYPAGVTYRQRNFEALGGLKRLNSSPVDSFTQVAQLRQFL